MTHDGGHPIKTAKIADLQKMVPFLPPCREFYTSLADHPVILQGSDDEQD